MLSCKSGLDDYKDTQPSFDLFSYFNGNTEAWGMVQDYSNKQTRRFFVTIKGTVAGNQLTLEEHFVYNDGEKQQRIWKIEKLPDGSYQGTAGDIDGIAVGNAVGNAFNWRYSMDIKTDNRTINLAGNWSNSANFTERSSTVTFDGATAHTLTGETFYNLTINNSVAPTDTDDVDSSAAVTFTNTSVGGTTNAWDFGDASTSSLASPTHTYSTAGTYNVKLTVTNANNCTDVITKQIVIHTNPSANFTFTDRCIGQNIQFANLFTTI